MANTQKLVKDSIDSKKGETANKRRKGAKNNETAAKVALMKLKMHADGDKSLPQERIYFQVFLPKGKKEKSKPMFFCHRWSIGKVIDFAASLASLKNDNNKLTLLFNVFSFFHNLYCLLNLGFYVLKFMC
uniref:ZFAND1-like ubiquitin-like domain-containing protein n=1 Tax=Sciurus vulgaris TaxID=55149 RepID=A0A8D2DL25_SCIVU